MISKLSISNYSNKSHNNTDSHSNAAYYDTDSQNADEDEKLQALSLEFT